MSTTGVDGKFAWLLVLSSGLTFFVRGGINRSFSIIYGMLLERYGRSDTETSWVPSIHGTVKMCSGPLVGVFIAKFKERKAAILGSILACTGLMLTAFAPSLEVVFLSYGFIQGIGISTVMLCIHTTIARWFDKRRGRAIAVASSFVPVGALTLGPSMPLLFQEYGYRGAILILGALSMHMLISAAMLRPAPLRVNDAQQVVVINDNAEAVEAADQNMELVAQSTCQDDDKEKHGDIGAPVQEEDRKAEDSIQVWTTDKAHQNLDAEGLNQSLLATQSLASGSELKKPRPVNTEINDEKVKSSRKLTSFLKSLHKSMGLSLLKNQGFTIYCMLVASLVMCQDIINSFLVPLLKERSFTQAEIALTLVVYNAFDIPSRLASGVLYDLRCVRGHHMVLSTSLFFFMSVFLMMVPLACQVSPVGGVAVFTVSAILRACVRTQNTTIVTSLVGRDNVTAGIALNRFCQGMGLLVASPLGGILKDTTGSYGTVFIVTGAFVATFSGLFILRTALRNICSSS